ncbi:aconitase X catalytic domain-containing protein [Candidatus Bathyarchaeota archaeon]|nr:aconitase X catalytic domain-containing protein [Candidatus Bathyarchaeota archaeon]
MYLSKDEEAILEGSRGEAAAIAMKLLVTIGDIFDAQRLIPVTSAQVSGISYKTIGDEGLEFIEEFARKGAAVNVHTTINPAGMDMENWREMRVPEDFAQKQERIVSALQKMGAKPTCTCTPYLLPERPKFGDHLAWAESSAVMYVNSIIGARTNREGGPAALASAVIGKTPLYGYHLEENRTPTIGIHVKSNLENELDFSLLGYYIGKNFPDKIPLIELEKSNLNEVNLKALGAGMATSGIQGLYHIKDVTPECKQRVFDVCERIIVERSNLSDVKESLSEQCSPEFICIGCPHCSIDEMEYISNIAVKGRFKKRVIIYTSRHVWSIAKKRGYLDRIINAGGRVVRDTCMVVSPIEKVGIGEVVTNSTKAAYYLSALSRVKTVLKSLGEALEYARNGN